jgi:hypothetical protein
LLGFNNKPSHISGIWHISVIFKCDVETTAAKVDKEAAVQMIEHWPENEVSVQMIEHGPESEEDEVSVQIAGMKEESTRR